MKRDLQFITNTFCYVFILVLLGVIGIYADCIDGSLPLIMVWYSLSNAASSALLTYIFLTDSLIKDCAKRIRLPLFLVTLYISITTLSIVFGIIDPSNVSHIVTMCVMIALIFLAVYFTNFFFFRQQEKELTEKLNEFNDSFDD